LLPPEAPFGSSCAMVPQSFSRPVVQVSVTVSGDGM
jgi:hypothetical protein